MGSFTSQSVELVINQSGLTRTTVRTVPTQQAYRSGIADIELESDNPPLFRPHDN